MSSAARKTRLLAVSDLHRDLDAARRIVEAARSADFVAVAGDLATVRKGLEEVVSVLSAIEVPAVLVAGNSRPFDQLQHKASEGRNHQTCERLLTLRS